MKLYYVETVFLGADAPNRFYFDTLNKAQDFLDGQKNGSIHKVTIITNESLNYWDGCTLCDLTYGFSIDAIQLMEVEL